MRIKIVHEFTNVTRARFVELFFDTELNHWFREGIELGDYEVESLVDIDGELRRVTWTHIPTQDLPRAATRALRGSELMLREETRYRLGSNKIRFVVRPNLMRRRVRTKGSILLEELDGKRLRRTLSAKIDVDIPFVGDLISDIVRDNLETVNQAIAKRMQQWINEHPD